MLSLIRIFHPKLDRASHKKHSQTAKTISAFQKEARKPETEIQEPGQQLWNSIYQKRQILGIIEDIYRKTGVSVNLILSEPFERLWLYHPLIPGNQFPGSLPE
jgi:hypothetical protein